MKCETAKNWLTQCDSLQARTWPRKIVRHVKHCRPCRHYARGVLRLEEGWRNQPLPVEARRPSPAFLQQIEELEAPTVEVEETPVKRKRKAPVVRRAYWPTRWVGALAAMLLLTIGVFAWLLLTPAQSHAGSDVVERLIDWNVEMTNAEPRERQRLLQELEAKFRDDLAKATLSKDDREFAESLLQRGCKLATSDDPLEEEEYIETVLKTQLEKRIEQAKGDDKERCGSHYTKFLSCNMSPLFQRAYQAKFNDTKRFNKDGPDFKGFDKGMFDKKGFDKGVFEKKGFDKKGFEEYLKMQAEKRTKELERWRQTGGPAGMKGFFPGPGMGHKH